MYLELTQVYIAQGEPINPTQTILEKRSNKRIVIAAKSKKNDVVQGSNGFRRTGFS